MLKGHRKKLSLTSIRIAIFNPVPFQFVVKRGAADTEHTRGLGFVPVHLIEHAEDGFFFRCGIRVFGIPCRRGFRWKGCEIGRQVAVMEQLAVAHGAGVFDDVFQFPDIAGPGMRRQFSLDALGQTGNVLGLLVLESADEVIAKQGDILRAFPERRQFNGYGDQAVVKVFPKGSLAHLLREIAIGGRHYADIGLTGFRFAEPFILLGFQKTQQLKLHLG